MAVDVSESVTVDASPDLVYEVISDLPRMAGLARECFAAWKLPAREGKPPRYVGFNRRGPVVWFTFCTVTLERPGEEFGYGVRIPGIPIAFWGYRLTPAPGGTKVTEYYEDRRGAAARAIGRVVLRVKDRVPVNQENIRATLDRLKHEVERSGTPSA